ncbi:MAG: hypothetical protein ACRDX9_06755 [Acidimicrobiia bacterium]
MWGGSGSILRRRLILFEFLLGAVGGLALGTWLLLDANDGLGFGLGLSAIGVGINYVPLAIYAVIFSRPGALEREMQGVDLWSELRYYMGAQFRVLVPLVDRPRRPPPGNERVIAKSRQRPEMWLRLLRTRVAPSSPRVPIEVFTSPPRVLIFALLAPLEACG